MLCAMISRVTFPRSIASPPGVPFQHSIPLTLRPRLPRPFDSNLADSDRNVDLYHWSSGQFSSTWYDTLSILVAKGRAKVGVAAAAADWSKRIRDMQYADYEDHTCGS